MRLLSSVVTVAAPDFNLTTLPEVKLEFDIQTTDTDVYLQRQIQRASSRIASICRRVFARQTYLDSYHSYWHWASHPHSRGLQLKHYPIVSVESVDVNGSQLVEMTDFDIDYESGRIVRMAHWDPGLVEITYTAGWVLPGWAPDSIGGPDLPDDVQQATIMMVLLNRQSGRLAFTDRDPFVRAETVEGVGSFQYSTTPIGSSAMSSAGGIPEPIRALLAPYMIPAYA